MTQFELSRCMSQKHCDHGNSPEFFRHLNVEQRFNCRLFCCLELEQPSCSLHHLDQKLFLFIIIGQQFIVICKHFKISLGGIVYDTLLLDSLSSLIVVLLLTPFLMQLVYTHYTGSSYHVYAQKVNNLCHSFCRKDAQSYSIHILK